MADEHPCKCIALIHTYAEVLALQVLERILAVDYHFPSSIPVSENCKDLLRHILVADPAKRYSIADIQKHPWYATAALHA